MLELVVAAQGPLVPGAQAMTHSCPGTGHLEEVDLRRRNRAQIGGPCRRTGGQQEEQQKPELGMTLTVTMTSTAKLDHRPRPGAGLSLP